MAEYAPPKKRTFDGKEYSLTAGTRQGSPTKNHAMSVVNMNRQYGYNHYRIVKVGKDFYAYVRK